MNARLGQSDYLDIATIGGTGIGSFSEENRDQAHPRLVRFATEEDVEVALKDACVSFPIANPAHLIEAYNRILDVLGIPDEDANIYGVVG